jgi:protein-tyrosine phosphatase
VVLDGQANFRDLGGYETVDGRRIRFGQIYRSGRLALLSDADLERLDDLGLRTVVNLLTADDRGVYGEDRLPPGAVELALPIDSDTATELANQASTALRSGDFSALPPTLNPRIHRLLTHDGRESFRALLETIADPGRLPLVFHCSHGVHRTGTAAAVLLSTLGVPWSTVRDEYLLSNVLRREEVGRRLGQLRELAAKSRRISPAEVDMSNAEAFLIQEAAYIDASRDEIFDEFSSFEEYAETGLSVAPIVLDALRDTLLE